MNEHLSPPAICCLAGILLLLTGAAESYLGARTTNRGRQHGGYGLISVGVVFLAGGLLLWAIGVGQ
ncbi:MAG: hypothetical protein GW893_22645 [Armatimonadetes bacterium]|nr:hypothetical protein [Armatimonadota bacterium]PIX39094.1 MAG: hypothetical protein COZ56_18605 [Armatimonadetes bacterium CG_4_8_14_3_um_filter_58_9]PIY43566.1 MAG: hypothetical protein COZ05_10640 [Armatimonadetes bacterium CG_4_10_14_3_um_filter_59_10]